MTAFMPQAPCVAHNGEGDEFNFVLCKDYEVDCGKFSESKIGDLEAVFKEENKVNGLVMKGRQPTPKKYYCEKICDGKFTIPEGFIFDGTSIPDWTKYFSWLIGFDYRRDSKELFMASIAHDWLYHTHQFGRAETDDLFFYMLRYCEVNWSHSWLMWKVVRRHGRKSWNSKGKYYREFRDLCKSMARTMLVEQEDLQVVADKLRKYGFQQCLIDAHVPAPSSFDDKLEQ